MEVTNINNMSGKRKEVLATNETYHVFNRTIGGEEIFSGNINMRRIMALTDYYRCPQKLSYSKFKNVLKNEEQIQYLKEVKSLAPLVEIYVFSFMPDHFHFLLRQNLDLGIRVFISNLQNAFAKYYNTKNERQGSLFQKPFKAKRVSSDEILLHVSRYIHLNPVTSYLVEYKNLQSFQWSSYQDYLVNTKFILKITGSKENYEKFVVNQVDYQRKLAKIKKFVHE